MLVTFIIGWFGANWWPGQWVDAPKPGGGDPWWMRPVAGILGGVAAVALVQMTHLGLDSLLGVTAVLGAGNVVGGLVGAVAGMARK